MSTVLHNPFRELRTRQGISQYELARRANISKHAVLRLEQGCYEKPLPSVISYFESYGADTYQMLHDYEDFQYQTRLSNSLLLGPLDDALSSPVGMHPLVFLRSNHGYNPTSLAKALCISQSTIVYFERSSIHQHTVPAQLLRALHDAEYTSAETDYLESAYDSYREWLNASKELTSV